MRFYETEQIKWGNRLRGDKSGRVGGVVKALADASAKNASFVDVLPKSYID